MSTATKERNGTAVGHVTNDARETIAAEEPYTVEVTIRGAATILFHAWSVEAVAEKAKAAKGSKAKKTDDVESYVYRNQAGHICLPGRYLIGSLTDKRNGAAKYRQDPRSPRKSALDLYKAGVISLTERAPMFSNGSDAPAKEWDYLDQQRVTVQQSSITRVRPAFLAGWQATFELSVLTPEYIGRDQLLDVLTLAGRLVGVGDFRPSYGRFQVTSFNVIGV
jgi:hypothetical protein